MKAHKNNQTLSGSKSAEKIAYTIGDIVEMGIISRSQLYKEVREERLPIHKVGRSSFILHTDFMRWLKSRPRKERISAVHRERALQGWKRRSTQVDAADAQPTPLEKGNTKASTPRGAADSSFEPSQADER